MYSPSSRWSRSSNWIEDGVLVFLWVWEMEKMRCSTYQTFSVMSLNLIRNSRSDPILRDEKDCTVAYLTLLTLLWPIHWPLKLLIVKCDTCIRSAHSSLSYAVTAWTFPVSSNILSSFDNVCPARVWVCLLHAALMEQWTSTISTTWKFLDHHDSQCV